MGVDTVKMLTSPRSTPAIAGDGDSEALWMIYKHYSNEDTTRNQAMVASLGNGYQSITSDDQLRWCTRNRMKICYGPRFDARRHSKEAKDYPNADGMLDEVYGGRR
jgi:hypothetical protein